MDRITIIGTGLIGSSIGLAIKRLGLKRTEVVGIDLERSAANKSKKIGAVDKIEKNLVNAVSNASIVFISTPVMAAKEIMEIIGPRLNEGTLVTDTGSTKREVMNWAKEHIVPYADFAGGHPMAGKESSGPEEADADLFKGKPWCLVPDAKASTSNVKILVDLITAIGATPYFIDETEHDSFVAAVSHMPFVLSTALMSCVARSPQWDDISRLASSGFRDVSRLASGDPTMHRDICITNRDYIGYWLDKLISELLFLKDTIVDKDASDDLRGLFAEALLNRDNWLSGVPSLSGRTDYQRPNVPSLAGIMFGEKMAEKVFGSGNNKDNNQIRR